MKRKKYIQSKLLQIVCRKIYFPLYYRHFKASKKQQINITTIVPTDMKQNHYQLNFHKGQFKDMPRSRKNFSRAQRGRLPFHQTFDIYSILHWNFAISSMDPTDMKNQYYPINLQNVPFQCIARSPCPPVPNCTRYLPT